MSFEITANLVKAAIQESLKDDQIRHLIEKTAECIKEIHYEGKSILIFGNGGSAADSQHFAAELVCTYESRERKPFRAFALSTDTSIITAYSNDVSYEEIFARQITAVGKATGLAIGLSTSGKSKSVLRGLEEAKNYGSKTCLISGNTIGDINLVDFLIKVPSNHTATIQTVTQIIYHSICLYLE